MTRIHAIVRRIAPMGVMLRRRPLVPELQPERLRFYLDTLSRHADEDGAILEVGCFRGATTVAACQHLRRIGKPARQYMIVDTFSGFASDQFDEDVRLGTPESFRTHFALNPLVLVERTMRYYGLSEVTVVQDDIVKMGEQQLPERVKVCLMDVDLAVPIEAGLRKIWPRLVPGGVILVDDCDAETDWRGAQQGYQRFCADQRLEEHYEAGFGVLVKEPG